MVVAGCFAFARPTFRGAVINPPILAPDFGAVDDRDVPFRMSDMRGKIVLLYFGYTHCPDECPMTMAHLKYALETLGPRAQNIQVVMITTDPSHDTSQLLDDFLSRFNPDFLGITGSPDDLARIYQEYHAVVLDGGKTHSSFTYVIDPEGYVRLAFLPYMAPEDIANDLSILLKEN